MRVALEVAGENYAFFVFGKGHLRLVAARVEARRGENFFDFRVDSRLFQTVFHLFPL